MENFDTDDNHEVKRWKSKKTENKRNRLKHLESYSQQDWRELIGSEYYLHSSSVEDVDLILDAFRLIKPGYIVATFSKSQNHDLVHFHYPRFIKVARAGLCKISVEELKDVENLFLELKKLQ